MRARICAIQAPTDEQLRVAARRGYQVFVEDRKYPEALTSSLIQET